MIALFFGASLVFALWALTLGWNSNRLPGVEFRQAQTAISIHFIQQENNYSLAYPMPVLGKPWSVPMEFPLYQWTVAWVGQATGLGLVQAGRLVSVVCFLGALPAVFLLLGHFGVARWRRLAGLAMFLTSPLLLFYSRAVLIETMALCAALWFVVAFLRAVETRHVVWLAVAMVAGSVAGLVKVTTLLLHMLPLVVWCLVRLWRERARWVSEVAWMAAAVAPAVVASVWWVGQADAIKALNLLAGFLDSSNLRGFNLGTAETRFSAEMWAYKLRILREEVTYWPLLIAAGFWLPLAGARRALAALGCAAVFFAALEIFPELYAYHDYYYVANVGWLLLAFGLVLVGLLERVRLAVAAPVLALAVSLQAGYFVQHYLPQQRVGGDGGDSLSIALSLVTQPDEVVVIAGQDWNSMTPFHARRRALMLRLAVVQDPALGRRALAALAPDRIGALVIGEKIPSAEWLLDELERAGFDRRPVLHWRGETLYLPRDRIDGAILTLATRLAGEVQLGAGRAWPVGDGGADSDFSGRWVDLATAPARQVSFFDGMKPRPVRFYAQFGVSLERGGGRQDFGAHPVTRLVFALPAGRHVLRTKVFFSPAAFAPEVAPGEQTNGVQVILRQAGGERDGRVFFDRLIDPVRRVSDRNRLALAIPFDLESAGEVELYIGPGPDNQLTRDWFSIDRLTIEPFNGR